MARIVVLGAGISGLATGMLLAGDGHQVTVLERDAGVPPPDSHSAWDDWERRGVNQFRMPHLFLPRFRQVLEAELPDVCDALDADGALRFNPVADAPESITGGLRPGDERFEFLTGRRPMVEAAFARTAASVPGLTVRRGVAVAGLDTDADSADGAPHVTGLVTEDGEHVAAELVVDASGRRSPLPRWLEAVGATPPGEHLEDSGFVYRGRYFRSDDGSIPVSFGGGLQHYDSQSTLTLQADNGTWAVVIVSSANDAAMRPLRDVEVWNRVVRGYPLIAHWLEGEPLTDIQVITKIEDRIRSWVVDGAPVATGVVAVGDAWACTNPSLGRGSSIALLHAVALRDHLGESSLDDAVGFSVGFHDRTATDLEPLYRDTLAFDRHRLAEIDAQIAGESYDTEDPSWQFGKALNAAASSDPDLLRGAVDIAGLLARGTDVFARPGFAERVIELAGDPADREPPPGPSRTELLELVGG